VTELLIFGREIPNICTIMVKLHLFKSGKQINLKGEAEKLFRVGKQNLILYQNETHSNKTKR